MISLKRSRAPSLPLSLSAHTHRAGRDVHKKGWWGIARRPKGREPGGDTRSESSHGVICQRLGVWVISYGEKTKSLVITRENSTDFLIDTSTDRTVMCWLHE